MPGNRAYARTEYRKKAAALRRHVARTGEPCWICGQPIDLTLPARHAMAFTADHVEPLARGGAVCGEIRPAHRRCNSRRNARAAPETITAPTTTREW